MRFLHNVTGLWLLSESVRAWEAEDGERIDLPALLRDAASVDEDVPLFDANDPRLSAPGDMPARIAAVLAEAGAAVPATRAAFARTIVESIAQAFAEAVHTAGRLTGREIDVIHIVGGGALNRLLCQATADRSGLPVLAGPVEATALGNVLVQARAHGWFGPDASLETLRARRGGGVPAGALRAANDREDPGRMTFAAAFDWARRHVDAGRLPTAVLGIADANGILALDAFGATAGRVATTDDHYRLFSITKPLVGLTAARAIERGLLTLETPLAAALPQFGAGREDTVRLRHLVSHTSGIIEPPLDAPQGLLPALLAPGRDFAAGTVSRYSSVAFEGVAAMIQHATGASWDDGLSTWATRDRRRRVHAGRSIPPP